MVFDRSLMLPLQKIVRRPLNMFSDLVPVRRPVEERSQNEHVQGSLQKSGAFELFDGRHSTLSWWRW
jgi:hypothetical protein